MCNCGKSRQSQQSYNTPYVPKYATTGSVSPNGYSYTATDGTTGKVTVVTTTNPNDYKARYDARIYGRNK